MRMTTWKKLRAIERALKVFALWVFFYRVRLDVPLRRSFGILNPSPSCAHGPVLWPWWKFIAVTFARCGPTPPHHKLAPAWNVWIYTRRRGESDRDYKGVERRNNARCLYFVIDMRVREAVEEWL